MLIFDAEIIRAIPPADANQRLDGVEYCAGWRDFPNMGLGVVALYCYARDVYRVYGGPELPALQREFDRADLIVGFNSNTFDGPLLAANEVALPQGRTYDLLAEIRAVTGRRFSLDDLAQANGGPGKNGNGADAPIAWQQGRFTEVINYCLNDVRETKRLLDSIIRRGGLYLPGKKWIYVRRPQ